MAGAVLAITFAALGYCYMMVPSTPESIITDAYGTVMTELRENAIRDITAKVSASGQGRLLAFRRGLIDLYDSLRNYETRMIELALDLGLRSPEEITDGISTRFAQQVPSIAKSLAPGLGGNDSLVAWKEATAFEDRLKAYIPGIASRVRLATELRRRKDDSVLYPSTAAFVP